MESKLKTTGKLSYKLFDINGDLKQAGETSNVICTQGNNYYVDQLSDSGGSVAQVFLLGTSDTAPGTADTWLGSAFAGNGTILAGGTTGVVAIATRAGTANILQYIGTFGAGYATQADPITEAILTNRNPEADGGGTPNNTTEFCIAHGTLDPTVTKAAGDTLVITWLHTLSGS